MGTLSDTSPQGVVAGGSVFTKTVGQTLSNWTADVPANTKMLFFMIDAQGRNGGTSDLLVASQANNNTCLSTPETRPAVTSNAPSATTTGLSPTVSATNGKLPSSRASSSKTKMKIAVMAGIVGGIIIAVLAVAGLTYFWWRRRRIAHDTENLDEIRRSKRKSMDLLDPPTNLVTDPAALGRSPYQAADDIDHEARPFTLTASDFSSEAKSIRSTSPFPASTSGRSRSKATMGGASEYQPRLIVHADIDEDSAAPVEELPPQYSAFRRPIPHFQQDSSRVSEGASNSNLAAVNPDL
jgi:hypothetical protein